jgi:dipeptidyl aminopeptidase/acylaminoacyl peptidase
MEARMVAESHQRSTDSGGAVKRYAVRDFFRRPDKHSFTIAPDGRHLSFLARRSGRQNIFVQGIDVDGAPAGEPHALTNETERDVPGHAWKGNDQILFVKDLRGDENFHVLSVPIDGSESRDLTPFGGVKPSIIDDLRDDDRHVLIQMNRRDRQLFDVFRVDVITGELTSIAENPGNVMGWMTDHEGRLRVAIASDGVNQTLLYRDVEAEPFRAVLKTAFRETVSPLFFTFDDKRLYVLSDRKRDKTAIFEFDPQTGEESALLFETAHVDVSGLAYSKKRRVLTSASYVDDRAHHHFFDNLARDVRADLERQLPGQEITVVSKTRDESRAIVRTSSDRSAGSVWIYDIERRHLAKLADMTPWLDPADLVPMLPIHLRHATACNSADT